MKQLFKSVMAYYLGDLTSWNMVCLLQVSCSIWHLKLYGEWTARSCLASFCQFLFLKSTSFVLSSALFICLIHFTGFFWEASILNSLRPAKWRSICYCTIWCISFSHFISKQFELKVKLILIHSLMTDIFLGIYIWSHISGRKLKHIKTFGWILGNLRIWFSSFTL